MYRGLAIIFGFLFLGEIVVRGLNLPIPGNVVGMVLLTLALIFNVVKIEDVEKEAELFVKNMSIMFIPPGVGIAFLVEHAPIDDRIAKRDFTLFLDAQDKLRVSECLLEDIDKIRKNKGSENPV